MKLSFRHHLLITAFAAFCVQSAGPAGAADKTWTGATSHAWATPSNWSTGSKPVGGDLTYINTTTNAPEITVAGELSTYLYVGNTATGSLTISSGGTLGTTRTYVGQNSGSTGTITVTDAGSVFTNSSFLYVGYNTGSTGTLIVTNSGHVNVSVFGLYVGRNGAGTLTISNGGTVESNDASYLGYSTDSSGTGTVTGVGSSWTSHSAFYVGRSSTGTLTISDGGAVESTSASYLGYSSSATGTATVTGAGSSWTSNSDFYVGSSGTGTLTISDGGAVESTGISYIGFNSTKHNSATITGVGSTWTSHSDFYIGRAGSGGSGTLTLSDSGTVSVAGITYIANQDLSTGTMNVGAASGSAAAAPGLLDSDTVTFGAGTGTIVFNHTSSNYEFSPDISGTGTITALSGTTSLTGDLSGFTGALTAEEDACLAITGAYNGTIDVEDGGTVSANGTVLNAITVNSGGTLKGSGTLAAVTIHSGGTMAPGNSIGTTNVTNMTFDAGSYYQVEVDAAGNSDLILDAGASTINGGTVQIVGENGASVDYVTGTTYTILTSTGALAGQFDAVTLDTTSLLLYATLSYDTNNAYVTIESSHSSFSSIADTGNQKKVATVLDTMSTGHSAYDLVLAQTSAADARNAMDALSGELHSNVKLSLMEDNSLVSDSIISHLFSARNDRAWATFIGDWQERGDGTDHTPFSSHSKGIIFGADQDQYGVAFAYLYNNYHQKDFSYDAKGHTLSLTAYGAEDLGKGFTLRGGMGYGLHTINSKRNIVLGSFNENLKSTYYAHHVQTFGEIAYPMEGFEPYARVTHTYLYTPDFSETGGETALTSHKNHGQLGSTTIGFKTSTALNLTDLVQTKLTAGAAWQHTFGNINPSGEYSFTDSAHFQSSAAPAAQDALQLTTGMSFELDGGVTIDLSYSGTLAHNAERHGLIGTVNWRF